VVDRQGSSFTVTDTTSATATPRADEISSAVLSDDEARNAAAWRLRMRKRPSVRCDRIGFNVTTSGTTAKVAPLVRLTFGDRASIDGLPSLAPLPGGTLSFFVERVTHTITPNGSVNEWLIDYDVSPTAMSDVAVVGTVGGSALGGFGLTTAAVNSSQTTVVVAGLGTWPATPFAANIEEEPVTVTAVATGGGNTTLTVTRTAPIGHDAGVEVASANCFALGF
jgi:hypothetical protein